MEINRLANKKIIMLKGRPKISFCKYNHEIAIVGRDKQGHCRGCLELKKTGPAPKKSFCKYGHEIAVVGRNKWGVCNKCQEEQYIPHPKILKKFCINGHEISVVGRYQNGKGSCKGCAIARSIVRWANMFPEDKKEHLKLANEWNRLHPEKRQREKLKRRYGISLEQYDLLVKKQEGKCAICSKSEDEVKTPKHHKGLGVDHDHSCCNGKERTCGKCIRGLLCTNCNSILGLANDDIFILEKAINYLKSWKVL
jgi:uncharacterized membrane protein